MEAFLRTDVTATAFPGSPTNSFLADEVASTCPLLTPSPPTNALVNPVPELCEPEFCIGEELATKLQKVKETGDSASSSSSTEPVCTHLLNHRNSYQHVIKDEITSAQETNGKIQPVQLTFRNPPENYFFMSWNWPVIRKLSMWVFLSGLVTMTGIVIAMISVLPRKCNPTTQWYQGGVFYEIFPASFFDSDGDMIGDFRGISHRVEYLQSMGIRAVRLNSIFATPRYPEDYKNFTSFTEIAAPLGEEEDFRKLCEHLHSKNISIVLDFHLKPTMDALPTESYSDDIADAFNYWIRLGVDGFYLKELEYFVNDPHFGDCLRRWKNTLGPDRVLIIDNSVVELTPKHFKSILLNHVDLVNIKLQIEAGATKVSHQIESVLNGTLFSKRSMPWVHWSLSDEDSVRLTNRLSMGNATLGATLLQLMLPGTPSLFYGDEIGLQQILDPTNDRKDLAHLHQFTPMAWPDGKFSKTNVLPWIHGEATKKTFEQAKVISKMVELRKESPAIYVNAVSKDGDTKASAEVKYSQMDLLVIQRWYPRRKSYVVVSNLGTSLMSSDLSKLLYSGEIVVGPGLKSVSETISFTDVSLWPGESVVIVLN